MRSAHLLLWTGILVCSTAANLIQGSRLDPVWLAGARTGIAAIVLWPWCLRDRRRHGTAAATAAARAAIPPGVLLGVHFMTFLAGVRMTSVANATLLVNLAPAIVPLFSAALLGERVARHEVAGAFLGLMGVGWLVAGDFHLSRTTFAGDLLCLGSMVFFAAYLVLGRRNRGVPGVWLYVVPLYATAALVCVPFAVSRSPGGPFDWREAAWTGGLALGPTVIGHSALMAAVRRLRSQTVTLANLTQFLFAGAVDWMVSGHLPSPRFYPAAALLVAGAVLAVRADTGGDAVPAGRSDEAASHCDRPPIGPD